MNEFEDLFQAMADRMPPSGPPPKPPAQPPKRTRWDVIFDETVEDLQDWTTVKAIATKRSLTGTPAWRRIHRVAERGGLELESRPGPPCVCGGLTPKEWRIKRG